MNTEHERWASGHTAVPQSPSSNAAQYNTSGVTTSAIYGEFFLKLCGTV